MRFRLLSLARVVRLVDALHRGRQSHGRQVGIADHSAQAVLVQGALGTLMSWLERLSTGQVASVERPDASVPAAGGNLARDRQDEADVIYGRYGR